MPSAGIERVCSGVCREHINCRFARTSAEDSATHLDEHTAGVLGELSFSSSVLSQLVRDRARHDSSTGDSPRRGRACPQGRHAVFDFCTELFCLAPGGLVAELIATGKTRKEAENGRRGRLSERTGNRNDWLTATRVSIASSFSKKVAASALPSRFARNCPPVDESTEGHSRLEVTVLAMAQSPFISSAGCRDLFLHHGEALQENVSSSSLRENSSDPAPSPSVFHPSSPALFHSSSSRGRSHASTPYPTDNVFSCSRPARLRPRARADLASAVDPVAAAGEMLKYAATQWELTAAQSEALVVALKVSFLSVLWSSSLVDAPLSKCTETRGESGPLCTPSAAGTRICGTREKKESESSVLLHSTPSLCLHHLTLRERTASASSKRSARRPPD